MQTERPWQSRTMWVNLISGIVALVTVFGVDLNMTPEAQLELVAGIMVVVNAINGYLRSASTKTIAWKKPPDGEPPTGI